MTPDDITYIENKLGWELSASGIDRANEMLELGMSIDGVVEAFVLL